MEEKLTIGKTNSGMTYSNKQSIISPELNFHYVAVDSKTDKKCEEEASYNY